MSSALGGPTASLRQAGRLRGSSRFIDGVRAGNRVPHPPPQAGRNPGSAIDRAAIERPPSMLRLHSARCQMPADVVKALPHGTRTPVGGARTHRLPWTAQPRPRPRAPNLGPKPGVHPAHFRMKACGKFCNATTS